MEKSTGCTILHVDMDAFFASVEQRDHPGLAGKCVIVGRSSGRGVVSAASYEARAFGVRSAMPVAHARRLCPGAIVIPPRMERYKAVSHTVMGVLETFSPLVEPVSIDEAYLNISGSERLCGTPENVARRIKAAVAEAVALPCSVGGAPLRFLAKIASDMAKPDGLKIVSAAETKEMIANLPVARVPGVGPVARRQLSLLGVQTLGEVRSLPDSLLVDKLGKFGRRLAALARGRDDTPISPAGRRRSVSAETTLPEDTCDRALLLKHLLEQAGEVSRQLRRLEARARVVVLKIKYRDFTEITRRTTLPGDTASAETIYARARQLLDRHRDDRSVRLIGVGVSELVWEGHGRQLDLFATVNPREKKWEQVERTLDAVSEKFGGRAVRRASLEEE